MFDALNKTAEAVMKHFEGDANGWASAIEAIYELYPARDMTKFTEYCDEEEYGLTPPRCPRNTSFRGLDL